MTSLAPSDQNRNNVALVLVSHSRPLAQAVEALARQMAGDNVAIICAAGAGDEGETLGTDAMAIMQAIESVDRPAGVVVLMDLGSALLSTDLALELLPPEVKENVHLTGCAFVEGAVAAATRAAAGATAEEVLQEAQMALVPKKSHLGEEEAAGSVAVVEESSATDAVAEVAIVDPNGLHARPAARIVTLAGSFKAKILVKDLTRNTGPVSATSLVALSSLGARCNDMLQITASGPEASQAVEALRQLVTHLTGAEEGNAAPVHSAAETVPALSSSSSIPVAAGIAMGPAVYLGRTVPEVPSHPVSDVQVEQAHLKRAIAAAHEHLQAMASGGTLADIIGIQIAMLADPALADKALGYIGEDHLNAAAAWYKAVQEAASVYANLDDPYLRARQTDVHDIGLAVLKILLGVSKLQLPEGAPCILIADELAPSEASELDAEKVLGVIDRRGGPTSHAAILLRAAGIPAIAGAAALVPEQGVQIIAFDGSTGEVWCDPDAAQTKEISARIAAWEAEKAAAVADKSGTATTLDGREIELLANVSGVADARAARQAGAMGIGLLRTEMLFLDRADAPTEAEQIERMRAIFDIFAGCPIVVRTLDAGGDKQIPYLRMENEANPYLGVRGVRLCLENKPLFLTQLRAILQAGQGHDVRIMIPMIADTDEIEQTRALLNEAHQALVSEKLDHAWPVPLGIMVEVPATAIRAQHFAEHSDFFSVGTNDLTQYTLAAERGHSHLGKFSDATNPAVLELIKDVVEAGKAHGRSVSVCGEAAGNVEAAQLLVGLGVKRLSMGGASLARVRKALKNASCQALEQEVQKLMMNA